jgi:hypothetical protein
MRYADFGAFGKSIADPGAILEREHFAKTGTGRLAYFHTLHLTGFCSGISCSL